MSVVAVIKQYRPNKPHLKAEIIGKWIIWYKEVVGKYFTHKIVVHKVKV